MGWEVQWIIQGIKNITTLIAVYFLFIIVHC